jgi:FkbM family methyltransferase
MGLANIVASGLNKILPFGWRLSNIHQLSLEQENVGLLSKKLDALSLQLSHAMAAKSAENKPRLYAYLGPDAAITQLQDGQFLYVDPVDRQIASHMIARGHWESWNENVVRRLAKPGDRVIEIGANLGYYSVIMASCIGATGRLDSFEANPRLARLVEMSLEFNGYKPFSKVHAAAAGDAQGSIRFAVSRTSSGGGHIALLPDSYGEDMQIIEAPMVRLDDQFPDDLVDFIRMDAEGSEPLVLAGAQHLIARSPNLKICMEWCVEMMAPRVDMAAFVASLRAQGLRFWQIQHDASIVECTDAQLLALPMSDVIACRRAPF